MLVEPIEIAYAEVAGEKLLADVYPQPAPPAGGLGPACALVVHGGGWASGDKRADLPFLPALFEAGIVTFSINYRLAPKHPWPACLDDVHAAVTWARRSAAAHGGDPNRLALVGYSSGGHLACMDALTREAPSDVAAIVNVAGATDMVIDNFRRGGISKALAELIGRTAVDDESLEILWQMSPINHLRPGNPPFLLVHGTADKSVPYVSQTIHFQKRIRDLGGSADLITLKDAPHRISEWTKFDPDYPKKMADWLTKTLAAK